MTDLEILISDAEACLRAMRAALADEHEQNVRSNAHELTGCADRILAMVTSW